MKWDMLEESKKLFPHWLDKNENSNFSKHLSILNHQQTDMRHKIKCVDWARLLNKPLQIHKTQTEPFKWKLEFEVNVPRLKKVNIYKNPTIVDNTIVNSYKVINGYYYEGVFYESHSKEITNLLNTETSDDSHIESDINVSDNYIGKIEPEEGKFYLDLKSEKYYKYENNVYNKVPQDNVPQTSLIYSTSFIDNYSHFFRHIIYESNENSVIINKFVVDSENNQEYKKILNYYDKVNNGKFELSICKQRDTPDLFYDVNIEKYCVFKDDKYVPLNDWDLVWLDYELRCDVETVIDEDGNELTTRKYYYIDNQDRIINIDVNNNSQFFIFTDYDNNCLVSRIPLIESEDITPVISNDRYVLEIFTWDDFHFLKGYPEIDFIDYNNNNIIDLDERTYDDLSIQIEKINNEEYLTFRIHQYGIKLVEILKDDKPIHIADFVIENYNYSTNEIDKQINDNFAHIFYNNTNEAYSPFDKNTGNIEEINLDVNEYVWRVKITDDDKIFDEEGNFELKNKYDLRVTYYNSLHPYESDYDKVLTKSYVCNDSIFYHDISLDVIGALYNVPRHAFIQPTDFETRDEELEFYSKTYPSFCNSLNEDDYHYQKRLEYYINNYNKIYFPVLELWKYFHIDSELVNRKVIVAEQNYSYMKTLSAEDNKYINELSKNKLDSYYANYENTTESETLLKPKTKSIISPDDYLNSRNGILIDENLNYIKDIYGNYVRTDYIYNIDEYGNYIIEYENSSINFEWYIAKSEDENSPYQLKLTDLLKVVPNTRYQLRFCVKKYPENGLNLKVIYKNNKGDVREVEESELLKHDYEDTGDEYNELTYTNYKKEWGVDCTYICTDFITLNTAQNVELCLEADSKFQISDITLQRVTINHLDSEYMRTNTDYNSCVYDLYADYNDIPSNIKYDDLSIFNKILNRSLPLSKVGYFNFALENPDMSNDMKLDTEVNIYVNNYNMLDAESGVIAADDFANVNEINSETNFYELTYNFNKYIKEGNYEIILKPFDNNNENNLIYDFNIDINMLVFHDDNTASYEKITINNFEKNTKNDNEEWDGEYFNIQLINDDGNKYFKIIFKNKSDNSFSIRLYRDKPFEFKNFGLERKSPLTLEELVE